MKEKEEHGLGLKDDRGGGVNVVLLELFAALCLLPEILLFYRTLNTLSGSLLLYGVIWPLLLLLLLLW